MNVRELSREQMHELKEMYLMKLADEGTFAAVLGVDYEEPSYEDLSNADNIVPDDVIFREYDGIDLLGDDFVQTT